MRAAEAYMPQILHRAGGVGGARVGAREPVAQLIRGVERRRAVEGHQRSRHTGDPHDVGAPAIPRHLDDLDQIRASCNRLFVTMHGTTHWSRRGVDLAGKGWRFYERWGAHKASRPTKAHAQCAQRTIWRERRKKKFHVSVRAQEMHSRSTGFPQLDPAYAAHYP